MRLAARPSGFSAEPLGIVGRRMANPYVKQYLMAAGPTPLPPRVVPGHGRADPLPPRARLRRGVRALPRAAARGCSRPRTTCSASPLQGSGGMESAAANLIQPGRRGRSSPRAASSASASSSWPRPGRRRSSTTTPAGATRSSPPTSTGCSGENPGVELVFTTFSETSTGVLNDIQALTQVAHEHDALIVVDAISGLGAVPLPQDEWDVDVVVAGSQKALMCPPGLGFASPNERALARAAERRWPALLLRLEPHREGPAQGPAGQPVHAGRVALHGARRRARADRGGGARQRLRAPPPARPRRARGGQGRSTSSCSAPRTRTRTSSRRSSCPRRSTARRCRRRCATSTASRSPAARTS